MTLVVAEIGINHNGSVDLAKDMISAAKACGADAVKFQKRTVETVYSQEELAKPREHPWGKTNGDLKRRLEFGLLEYEEIAEHARRMEIEWFASAWDLESLDFLEQFNPIYQKVASAMLTHKELVREIAARGRGRTTLVSTGMTSLIEILDVVRLFNEELADYVLMHCVSTYPTPEEDLNLYMIQSLREWTGAKIGYSGHEVSPWPSVIAVALGAEVVERHFTLDRSMFGSDQAASLEPHGFKMMVDAIRALPTWLGSGIKRIAPGEAEVARKLRYWEV